MKSATTLWSLHYLRVAQRRGYITPGQFIHKLCSLLK